MKIAVVCNHVGSHGIKQSGQYGGGELYTFAVLKVLDEFYDVTAIVPNGIYPSFDSASQYGLDLYTLRWKPLGDDIRWIQSFDVMLSIMHDSLMPPICRRNIIARFFPQHPEWDISGYDTVLTISRFSAEWIMRYHGMAAQVVYPPVPLVDIQPVQWQNKEKRIIVVGRFFEVPGGNNKNHAILIEAFKELMLPDWSLHLVGAVQNEAYYRRIRDIAGNDKRIHFHHDISRQDYVQLLQTARFVWGATGYQAQKPSSREHFGVFAVEAMAAGCVPIVHNSGGTPEIGCLVWDEPVDLLAATGKLIHDEDQAAALSLQMQDKALEFSFPVQGRKLVEVIESPVVLLHDENRSRIYVGAPPPTETKVALVSDSPTITTGFGVVTRMVGAGLKNLGYQVVSFGLQDPILQPRNDDPWMIWRGCRHDPSNWNAFSDFFSAEQPSVVYLNYDLGNIRAMLDRMRQLNLSAPIIAYFPVEGVPVNEQFIETIRLLRLMNGTPVTYTKTGVKAIMDASGPKVQWAYHGCDHARFRRLSEAERDQMRFAVGWHDKFVCMMCGRNKRTKGFGALLDTAAALRKQGANVVWYLHTNPDDGILNSSAPLRQMVHQRGLDDVIFFPPDLGSQTHGIPYDEPPFTGQVPDTDDIMVVRECNMHTLSMIERYNLADLYVNLSEVEGFGLPPLEAMGCGVPVLSVDDNGVQREVLGDAPFYVGVSHWDTWHTGARLAQVNPNKVAQAILELMYDPGRLGEMSKQSSAQHAKYKWSDLVVSLHRIIQEVIA